jgi:glycosyltransferase involved in cell wall biosynthesis
MQTSLLESSDSTRPASRPTQGQVRVLHIINGEDYAGAERVQDTLALRLPELGYEVGFACLKQGRFAQARHARRSPVYEIPMRSKLDLAPVRRLTDVVRAEGYQIIHTHTPRTALVGAAVARRARVPLVHHIHCQTAVEVGRRRWQDKLNLFLERCATYRAGKVIAVSPSLHRYLLRRGYSSRQLRLVPNGVPVQSVTHVGRTLGRSLTVGVVALLRPRKGMEVLLHALALLREQGCPARLRAVGRFQSASYEREVKRLAARLRLDKSVDWVGFRQDVAGELSKMDVLVLPSLVSEAMPMSVLEAMAAGVLVVGTRVDGITDLICDGEDGLLAHPGDVADMASVLKKIISGEVDCERLRAKALGKQRERYSDGSLAIGVAEIYDEVLDQ